MTREEQIDWLYRLRADLNNGIIFAPWKKEFTEALTGVLDQEPCEDAISRENTLKAMIEQLGIRNEDYLIPAEATLYKVVKKMPPVIPQPKMGHWIEGKYKDTCDKCRCTYPKNIGFKKYCPNCGAKMIEPQESEGV